MTFSWSNADVGSHLSHRPNLAVIDLRESGVAEPSINHVGKLEITNHSSPNPANESDRPPLPSSA